jgi:hypothetical protein
METIKQILVSNIANRLTALGLSTADTKRLAKRIEELKIGENDRLAVLRSVAGCINSGQDFAWRAVKGIFVEYVFYGPTGFASIEPIELDIKIHTYEDAKTSFQALTGVRSDDRFIYIQRATKEENIAA